MRVVVLSSARWGAFQVSKQLVSHSLADLGHEVLYVDPPISPLSFIRHPDRLGDLRTRAVRSPREGVTVWTPRVIPGQNSSLGQSLNAAVMGRRLESLVADPHLAVTFSLEARTLFAKMSSARRIYYCVDSHEDLPGVDAAALRSWEKRIVEEADRVVACSKPLVEQLASRGTDAVYIPHGCDPHPIPEERPLPPELEGRPRPFAGYVGSINFRIDGGLLEAARRGLDGGTLILIGSWWSSSGPKLDRVTARLLEREDVVTTGHRGLDVLPSYLETLDVGLVPYTDTPFNRKSFPVKIPQYLAAGVPVVSTANGATDEYHDVVRVASDAGAFEDQVRLAIAARSDETEAVLRLRGRSRPWSAVASDLLQQAALA